MNRTVSTNMLLAAIVVSGVTTFMFYPLITLELLKRGQSTLAVGIILGLLSGVGPTLSIFIGQLNATIGSKRLTLTGLIFRSLGLCVFAFNTGTAAYALGAVVASLASRSLVLAIKTELMRTSTSRRMVALRSMMISIGALIGPSIGGILFLLGNFSIVVVIVVISYILLACALLTVTFQPPEETVHESLARLKWSDLNQPLLVLCACVFGYWTIYSFWPLIVPIIAKQGFGTPVASSWVYTFNAILILALQYWLIVKRLAEVTSTVLLGIGFTFFIAAFICLSMPIGALSVIVFAMLFSMGEMLVSPTLDEITGRIPTGTLGLTRAYGVTGTVGGIGSMLGAPIGGLLIDRSGTLSATLWFVIAMAVICISSALFLKKSDGSL